MTKGPRGVLGGPSHHGGAAPGSSSTVPDFTATAGSSPCIYLNRTWSRIIPMDALRFRRQHAALYCDKGRLWGRGWSCSRYPGHDGPCALHATFWNFRHWHDFRSVS